MSLVDHEDFISSNLAIDLFVIVHMVKVSFWCNRCLSLIEPHGFGRGGVSECVSTIGIIVYDQATLSHYVRNPSMWVQLLYERFRQYRMV